MQDTIPNIADNNPNPFRLIEALRNVGYDTFSAISDIVDNSIDAKATNIQIDISKSEKNGISIEVIDNGSGMTVNTLDQAMRLGSNTDRETKSDLGKFGMGLITASISIGKLLTVVSKYDNKYTTSIQDIDHIVKVNKFEKEIRNSTDDEIQYFNLKSGNSLSGTMVRIQNCDLIHNRDINELVVKLESELSRIFRYFISKEIKILVNNRVLKVNDPLYLSDKNTEIRCDDSFDLKLDNKIEKISVKIVLLPNFDTQTMKIKKINISNQGFYIMRNNREIASGLTLGTFTKHNDYNRLRMELSFSGSLDQEMNINFTKKNISPIQSILNNIKLIVGPQIVSIRKKIKTEQASNDSANIDHDIAAKIIANKSKLLIKPKIKIETRNPAGDNSGSVEPKHSENQRIPKQNSKEILADRVNCKFEFRSKGDNGVLFDCEQLGKKTIIYYNVDHPFYQSFIAKNKDNQELINAFDFFVYALSSAQLTTITEDNVNLFDTYQSIFSSNLRTLIS